MSINFSDGLEDQAMVTSSSILPEDAGEGGLRPKTISEYIGQEKAKDNLSVFIDAARSSVGILSIMSFCTDRPGLARQRLRLSLQTRWASICASPLVLR